MLLDHDTLLILFLALLLDGMIGDPDAIWRRWPHPVVWIGGLIGWGDRLLNRETWSADARQGAGSLLLVAIVTVSVVVGLAIHAFCRDLPGGALLLAAISSIFIAQRSLYGHVARVRDALRTGGLAAGRSAVAMIVGRDPERLDEAGVCRAAIESAAENFADGVVAPAFWFALFGLPGLLAYKAVNTADSMIGHLSHRHRDFGWAAARTDDVLNLIPARFAAGLIAAVAGVARGGSPRHAMNMALRDAGLHRSPNAGWPEAAMAGALGLALAGPRVYPSGTVDDPFLNREGRRTATPDDIGRALRVLLAAAVLHAVVYLGAAVLLG